MEAELKQGENLPWREMYPKHIGKANVINLLFKELDCYESLGIRFISIFTFFLNKPIKFIKNILILDKERSFLTVHRDKKVFGKY